MERNAQKGYGHQTRLQRTGLRHPFGRPKSTPFVGGTTESYFPACASMHLLTRRHATIFFASGLVF